MERIHYVIQCSGCGGLSSLAEVDKDFINRPCGCGGKHVKIPFEERQPAWIFKKDNVLMCHKCRLLTSIQNPNNAERKCKCGGNVGIRSFSSVFNKKIKDTGVIQCPKCKYLWSPKEIVNQQCVCGSRLEKISFWNTASQ